MTDSAPKIYFNHSGWEEKSFKRWSSRILHDLLYCDWPEQPYFMDSTPSQLQFGGDPYWNLPELTKAIAAHLPPGSKPDRAILRIHNAIMKSWKATYVSQEDAQRECNYYEPQFCALSDITPYIRIKILQNNYSHKGVVCNFFATIQGRPQLKVDEQRIVTHNSVC